MHLVRDNTTEAAALKTIRELIAAGLAGNDCYDHQIFVVDAPKEYRDHAEIALDHLGASFHKDGAYRAPRSIVQCQLPNWVRAELGLDDAGAPMLVVPLASRGVSATEALELGSTRMEREQLGVLDVAMDRLVH